jgi:hypothetical protein
MLGKKTIEIFSCCYEHYCVSVRQGDTAGIEGHCWRGDFNSPSWIHGQARG